MHSHTEIHLQTLEQIVYCLCGQVRSCIDVSSQCTVPWWSPTRNQCSSKRPWICCIINSQPYAVTAVVVLLHWLLNSLRRAKNLSGKWARSEACTHTRTNTHCNMRKLIRRILRVHQFAGHTRNLKKKSISYFLSSKIAISLFTSHPAIFTVDFNPRLRNDTLCCISGCFSTSLNALFFPLFYFYSSTFHSSFNTVCVCECGISSKHAAERLPYLGRHCTCF